jgi:protocatechuate 3,4-dioxygenase, beta subunit
MRLIQFLILLILFTTNLLAKDPLIPADGRGNNTLIDYDSLTKKWKGPHGQFIALDKEVYFYLKRKHPFIASHFFTEDESGAAKIINLAKMGPNYYSYGSRAIDPNDLMSIWPLPKSFANLSSKRIHDHILSFLIQQRNRNQVAYKDRKYKFFNVGSNIIQTYMKCPITPTIKINYQAKPKISNFSNNLRRKTASTQYAAGDIIYVKGRLQDINCLPIDNTAIKIWQKDAYGTDNLDKNFVGGGAASTDNMGNFSFITVLPNSREKDIAPHINIEVQHKKQKYQTKIYFSQNIRNNSDKMIADIDAFNKSLLIGEILPVNPNYPPEGYSLMFNITLDQTQSYKDI